ncbi:MAG: hypothetical protein JWM02_2160 [Frankiales bacterium]|nr:hypothetical protein [Frankiales bacterium]
MKGSYRVGEDVEQFSCGAGPVGWRYVGTRAFGTGAGDTVDLTVDEAGRVVRLLAQQDGWELRGGSVGEEVLWVRGEDEHRTTAAGFTGSSPAYDVATARLLGLQVGETRRLTLVEVCEPVAAARTVEQGWARTEGPEPDVDRYEVADLQTGDRWVVHLSAEVLISREGARTAALTDLQL